MSEKRFTYDKPVVAFSKGGINDNVTGEIYEFTMNTVLDLLNELHEERNYFERKKCEYWNKFNLAHLDNINLRKENEQLKKEILWWKYRCGEDISGDVE